MQFSVIGRHLIYLSHSGYLRIVFCAEVFSDEQRILSEQQEENIGFLSSNKLKEGDFRFPKKIVKFYERYRHLVVKFEDSSMMVCLLQDITMESLQDVRRYRQIQSIGNVLGFGVGYDRIYVLNQRNQLLLCDLSLFTLDTFSLRNPNEILPIQNFPFFEDKKIIQIYCGLHFFFALEREESSQMIYWDNQTVLAWASNLPELQDYMNILRYQKVTGADLVQKDELVLKERLGFKSQIIALIRKEQKKYSSNQVKKQILYGWGQNGNGQLGIENHMTINTPRQIRMPELKENERVLKVVCGWKNSAMVTDLGRLFINQKFEKSNEKNIRYKSNKKAQRDYLSYLWQDITSHFQQKKKQFFIKDIFLGKQDLQVLAIDLGPKTKSLPLSPNTSFLQLQNQQKKKLSADKLLNKIQWSPDININEVMVGYKQKNGTEELKCIELLTTKFHYDFILYVKMKGLKVWDRKTMIYIQ